MRWSCDFGLSLCDVPLLSNWSSIYAHSYEPEIVHDFAGSEDEQCYDEEDDSNGEDYAQWMRQVL